MLARVARKVKQVLVTINPHIRKFTQSLLTSSWNPKASAASIVGRALDQWSYNQGFEARKKVKSLLKNLKCNSSSVCQCNTRCQYLSYIKLSHQQLWTKRASLDRFGHCLYCMTKQKNILVKDTFANTSFYFYLMDRVKI